jgi:ECF transporter S component (folate family)
VSAITTSLSAKFLHSAKEFKNIHSVTGTAVLMALDLVLSMFVSIQITQTLKLGLAFLAVSLMGMLYGPVMAGIGAGTADVLSAVIRPTGPFFPGFILTAVLGGIFYGCFLYEEKVSIKRLVVCKLMINVLLNILLNSLWLKLLYGKAFFAMLPMRAFKNLALLPVEILLMYLLLPRLKKIKKA